MFFRQGRLSFVGEGQCPAFPSISFPLCCRQRRTASGKRVENPTTRQTNFTDLPHDLALRRAPSLESSAALLYALRSGWSFQPIPRYPVPSRIRPFVTWNVLLHTGNVLLSQVILPARIPRSGRQTTS